MVVSTAIATAVLVGCGDDDTSAQEEYCDAGASLRSSLDASVDLDLVAEGTNYRIDRPNDGR